MANVLFIVSGIIFAMLVFSSAVRPVRSHVSTAELTRRQKSADNKAKEMLAREKQLLQLQRLVRPVQASLIVLLTTLMIIRFGGRDGLILSLFAGTIYPRIAELAIVRQFSNTLYKRFEPGLLGLVRKYKKPIRFIAGEATLNTKPQEIQSKEELAHILSVSPAFSEDDKRLIKNILSFKDKTVSDCMTPKKAVVTIADTELLGPLVLDDLHKTSHTVFPVMKGKSVVGLLDSSEHSDLRIKESVHVRAVMSTDIYTVREDMLLCSALKEFLSRRLQMIIVADDKEQMTGILTLKDCIRAIFGP